MPVATMIPTSPALNGWSPAPSSPRRGWLLAALCR